MKYYFVIWKEYMDRYNSKYHSSIITCSSKAKVKRIIKNAYVDAYAIKIKLLAE